MKHRPAVGRAHLRQLGVLIEYGHDRLFAAGLKRLLAFADGLRGTVGAARSALLTSRAEHVRNLVVAALAREDVRAGRVPLGPDAAVRVGSKFEQQPGHFEIAPEDGHVHRPHFAAAQVHNLRAAREQLAGSLEIAALDGLV